MFEQCNTCKYSNNGCIYEKDFKETKANIKFKFIEIKCKNYDSILVNGKYTPPPIMPTLCIR